MGLLKETTENEFDLTAIEKGWLVWCRHSSWDFDRKGIVTGIKKDVLIVQFYPKIGNVTNHTIIPVNEVADGQWEIRWSEDLTEVFSYPEPDNSGDSGNQGDPNNPSNPDSGNGGDPGDP